MANAFLTPDVIAPVAMATLYEKTAMLPLVWKDLTQVFSTQKIGSTVNIKRPTTFEARKFNRTVGIQPQEVNESTIPVVLDTIWDVSVPVTTEEMTLDVMDFNTQIALPAMEAISQAIDQQLMSLRNDVTQVAGLTAPYLWNKPEVLIDAGRQLNVNKVPVTGRSALIGANTYAEWLNSDLLKRHDGQGDNSSQALREGSIGDRLFGFDAYWSNNVEPADDAPAVGAPTTEVGLAFHESAFAFASAPLALPNGAQAATISYKGLSIRVVYGYDQKYKQEVVSFDTLCGVKTLDPTRAVKLKGPNRAA
jgi:hypothetical protein